MNIPTVKLLLDLDEFVKLTPDEGPLTVPYPDVVYVVRYGRDGDSDHVHIVVPRGDLELRVTKP